ncbi:MAG: L-idonate 5-dehydrogenase [Geminicoccaceae bacterium]|nr:L-idonate 5-dehydrogenase [Geminicoccaceae bacterium]MDW8371879.1 L-idonate 5-dehydrogenase [Geminicoccaceae bacterium]
MSVRAVVCHAAHDLRVEERALEPLGPHEVRVKLGAGGICGSDLHYYHEGGIGDVAIREPLVLGHEMAGTVVELGPAVHGLRPGTPVAVNPTWPCPGVRFDLGARAHLDPQIRFAGSARTLPHTQGFFQELVTVRAEQCRPVPPALALEEAAMAEPLACCLHAIRRAREVLGRHVLVLGCGPIGCLTIAAARLAGAARITACDLIPTTLAKARAMGADEVIDLSTDRGPLDRLQQGGGVVDVVVEAAGSPAALRDGLLAVRRGGTFVQFGVLPRGMHPIPVDSLVAKELDLLGTFRFWEEFDWAVDAIAEGRVDVRPLLTELVPLSRAEDAFELASDRRRAMKVQLVPG